MGEVKSTHLFQAGGHHELKYGWHLEYSTFDQDSLLLGPARQARPRAARPPAAAGFSTYTFFTPAAGQYPSDFGDRARPRTSSSRPRLLRTTCKANVTSLSNAFFLQDSYSPPSLRNLTVNAGARLELQKMYDTDGKAFLDTDNLARASASSTIRGATAGRRSPPPTAATTRRSR